MQLENTQNLSNKMQCFLNQLGLISFKEDNVFFVYAPNLDICGYGLTTIEAQDSFIETLKEFISFTTKNKTLEGELKRLGWEKLSTKIPYFYHQATCTLFEPFNSGIFDNN